MSAFRTISLFPWLLSVPDSTESLTSPHHVFRGSYLHASLPLLLSSSDDVQTRGAAVRAVFRRESAVTNVSKVQHHKTPHKTSFAHHFYSKDTFISYTQAEKNPHILLRFINKHRDTSLSRHKMRTTTAQSSGAFLLLFNPLEREHKLFGTWLTPGCETHPFGNVHIQHGTGPIKISSKLSSFACARHR